jgi:hypothetical protein
MLLVEVHWAARVWALPFLSALAPSERYAAKRGKRHKKVTEWTWQLPLLLRRWYPEREIVALADRAYATLKLLDRCRKLEKFDHLHHPSSAGCGPLRVRPTAPSWAEREAPPKGRAGAQPFEGGRRPENRLETYQDR